MAAYRSAIDAAEPQGDAQGLVPALSGLALLVVDDDPDEALRLAQRAVEHAAALDVVSAHLALGRVHLLRGDRAEAAAQATVAQDVAGTRRERRGLALALELAAESDPRADRGAAAERLDEALRLWRELGSPLGELGNRLARARLWGGAPHELADIVDAATRLGARGLVAEARDLHRVASPDTRVRVRTLGGFGVDRGGEQVPLAAWQSKKARDLLKILVARRGSPVHREAADGGAVARRAGLAHVEPSLGRTLHPAQRPGRRRARHRGAGRRGRPGLRPARPVPRRRGRRAVPHRRRGRSSAERPG